MITELQNLAKQMEDELKKWKESVKCRRKEFYELNYFNTVQLLALRKEIGKLSKGSCNVSPNVLAMLQSISSQVTTQVVSDVLTEVINQTPQHLSDAEVSVRVDVPTLSHEKPSINLHSSFEPTTSDSVVPELTEDGLDEKQKEMVLNLSSRLSCSKQLVLMAFEQCPGDEKDRYDIAKWCTNNMDMDTLEIPALVNSEADSDSEGSSDSDDSVYEEEHFNYSSGIVYKLPILYKGD
jgi:hypothetical protein